MITNQVKRMYWDEDGKRMRNKPDSKAWYTELVPASAYVIVVTERDQMRNALEAAEQCIGELPPTQARVEVMQMIQAALVPSDGQ